MCRGPVSRVCAVSAGLLLSLNECLAESVAVCTCGGSDSRPPVHCLPSSTTCARPGLTCLSCHVSPTWHWTSLLTFLGSVSPSAKQCLLLELLRGPPCYHKGPAQVGSQLGARPLLCELETGDPNSLARCSLEGHGLVGEGRLGFGTALLLRDPCARYKL